MKEFGKHSFKILELKCTIIIMFLREKPSDQGIQSLKHLENKIIKIHK